MADRTARHPKLSPPRDDRERDPQTFSRAFREPGALVLPSAPLVPRGDPSTLFISAGMQPLQPYYLGLSDPPAPRLASAQKCLRTGDIDEVGKTDRHNTFFEMLGNFTPTGAYFKETAIPLAWELVTEGFEMPVDRLRVTIHPTDDEALRDLDAAHRRCAAEHITRLGDNWWGLGRGPCGPDSEIWWDRGSEVGCGRADCVPDHCDRFTEFWNLVFPQYDQRGDSGTSAKRSSAASPTAPCAAARPRSTPAWASSGSPTSSRARRTSSRPTSWSRSSTSFGSTAPSRRRFRNGSSPTTFARRRSASRMASCPSNEGRGYVLRRLIRRAARSRAATLSCAST